MQSVGSRRPPLRREEKCGILAEESFLWYIISGRIRL